jgi:hypothetical protein
MSGADLWSGVGREGPSLGGRSDAAPMFGWLPAPALVLCDSVSVIAGVRHPQGVVMVADRAAVDPARDDAPGVPMQHGEQPKLFLANTRVAVALAGLRTPPGQQVDLLDVCRRAVAAAPDAPQASVALEARSIGTPRFSGGCRPNSRSICRLLRSPC